MASNILSRLLPPATSPSIYETMKEYDESSDTDVEERAGLSAQGRYRDDLDSALNDAMGGSMSLDGGSPRGGGHVARASKRRNKPSQPQQVSPQPFEPDEADDDVPLDLLVETDSQGNPIASPDLPAKRPKSVPKPIPPLNQPSGVDGARWNAAQEQQRLYKDPTLRPAYAGRPRRKGALIANPKDRAMWKWANVQNLDVFLQEAYTYFYEKGIYSIILNRVLNLLTFAFVVGFSTFLTSCIDYSKLKDSKKMEDIYINQCAKKLSGFSSLLIWFCAFFWLSQLVRLIRDIPRLKYLHDFYLYLLEVPDIDIQTISWQDIVKRLMSLRDANPTTTTKLTEHHRRFLQTQSKQRMDAHDIANRLMRRDNYLIALINKDTLDLTLPLPYMSSSPLLSRSLEWNLSLTILDYIFDDRGQVRSIFLKDAHRKELSTGLRRRFAIIGVLNMFIGPFMVAYVLALYFFRNFSEYQKDPASIGSRQYTPYAKWKFREFNELSHLFTRRMNMSYPFASRYINQFPKDKMTQLAQFIAFVAGALAAVLAVVSLVDPDLFLGFEITHDKTVLFYLGVFSAIWAFARGAIPEENLVYDPEFTMNEVIHFTHYEPSSWKGRLHSDEIRKEFVTMYQMKLVIFLQEILSMITTPFILYFSLSECSERIIDFVREFTVHVDGLGYVCSFAVFDFQKSQNQQRLKQTGDKAAEDPREEYYATKDNKMLASFFNFMDHYSGNGVQRPSQAHAPHHEARQFRPPPAFPGMMSSHMAPDRSHHARPEDGERFPRPGSSRHGQGLYSGMATQRTPRFAPSSVPQSQSPMHSILLDPHHQPSSKSLHKSKLRNMTSPRRMVERLVEDDENNDGDPGQSGSRGSNPPSGHGDLSKSWMLHAQEASAEDIADYERDFGKGEGMGALQLAMKIVKEQTADRGTGAGL